MVPSVYALGAIMAMVAGIIQADSSTYVRPEKALHELQQLRRASDKLSSSDIDRITSVGESLSPLKVFQVITETSGDVSDTCFNQTLYVLESIVNGGKEKTWALQLIDSWGKPGAGITQLNINWLGDFDECMGVKSYYNTSIGPTDPYSYMPHSFVGRYCGLGAVVGPPTVGLGIPVGINVGSCFPSGCTDTDISTIVTLVLRGAGLNVTEDVNVGCQERELPYSTGAIVTIVVYCVMGAMCLLATLYDFVHNTEAPQTMLSTEENGAAASKSDHSVSVMSSDADLTTSAARSDSSEDAHGDSSGVSKDTEILITPTDQNVGQRTHSALGEFLMCFSLYTNGYKLLSTKQPPGSLKCLHGIRFLSLTWVILGHTLVFSLNSVVNPLTLFAWMKTWSFQVLVNGTVSVDSFFVLSAVLTSYLLLVQLEKGKTISRKFFISVPVMYLHRYIRLTPAYGFMLLFYTCLMLYSYDGPLKPVNTAIGDAFCSSHWYANILYVNNVVKPLEQCAPWSWYLSDDFQYFLLTPFVVYMLYRLPVGGVILSVAMVIASIGSAIGASVKYDLGVAMFFGRTSFLDPVEITDDAQDYYYAPWTRYQSFGIGILFGYCLWRCNGKMPLSKVGNVCMWVISLGIMLAVLYGPYELIAGKRVGTVAETAIYNGFGRTGWSIALGYIILACCLESGGWVNELLSWPGFVPLSRMTYCAYLVHPVIMTIITSSQKNKVYWSKITLIYMFGGYLVCAYSVAFIFSLVFEVPFMLIDKKYLTGKLK